jgi:hypothetical protein
VNEYYWAITRFEKNVIGACVGSVEGDWLIFADYGSGEPPTTLRRYRIERFPFVKEELQTL